MTNEGLAAPATEVGPEVGLQVPHLRGFTLVEVMIALSIFALAATAAVVASSQHLSNLSYMQEKTMARLAASNALARMTLTYPPENGDSGSELIADQYWPWRASVSKTATAGVYQVVVSVYEPRQESSVISGPSADARELHQLARFLGPQSATDQRSVNSNEWDD